MVPPPHEAGSLMSQNKPNWFNGDLWWRSCLSLESGAFSVLVKKEWCIRLLNITFIHWGYKLRTLLPELPIHLLLFIALRLGLHPLWMPSSSIPSWHLSTSTHSPTLMSLHDTSHDMGGDLPMQYGCLEELPTVWREHVEALEACSMTRLLNLVRDYTPHLAISFTISPRWWKSHEQMPEAHVSWFQAAASLYLY